MSELDRLVYSCMLPGVTGTALPPWVRRGLEAGFPGVTIFPGPHLRDPATISDLAAAVHEHDPHMLVSLDEEGGDVTRLEYGAGSSYPGNLALGVVDDPALTRRVALAMAGDLLAHGVNYNLAPSVDVNSDPGNPVIGVRSFGARPDLVAVHGAAFIDAMQEAGVAAAAKHFPGHGDTTADPHHSLPVVTCPAGTLRRRELTPFAAAAAAASVMIAHVVYSALDPKQPATLSRRALREVLRDELGYRGVALSTAVAIEAGNGPEQAVAAAVTTLAAGADLVLLGPGVDEELYTRIHAAVAGAIEHGVLAIEESAERVGLMRRRYAVRAAAVAADPGPVGGEAARRAVRGHGAVVLPGPAAVAEVRAEAHSIVGEAAWSMAEALDARSLLGRAEQIHGPADPLPPAGGPLVIVVRDAYRIPWMREWTLKALADRPGAILVAIGMPDDAGLTSGACITTFGAGRVNLQAAADLLAGP
ncbi:glycoside hydrolase family 3 N-terminal domain-containing protein [Nonomuraea typhae]|uniref:glycoside hydrolase family 3 N-terminal domain-containing protein n=1 Tax=Nonomuraea typhae TaxID=2603600 RepID=UPI0012FC5197|nr:glycoside hydrolase family 3 N-terminal domain-containing protein [Nonomuraea typhae]